MKVVLAELQKNIMLGIASHWQNAVSWSTKVSNSIHPSLPHLTALVGITIIIFLIITKCMECFVRSRRKLDQVKDDDALLADASLRALRRTLLIADIQNHPSRLLKSINDNSERERIRNTGLRGDGLTSIFLKI